MDMMDREALSYIIYIKKKHSNMSADGAARAKLLCTRDCMMVVKEIVNRLLEEVEVSLFGKKQDIDNEGEVDEEDEGGSKV
ncbi:hypothetical protein Tco_0442697 [Tanacetum coccineum]